MNLSTLSPDAADTKTKKTKRDGVSTFADFAAILVEVENSASALQEFKAQSKDAKLYPKPAAIFLLDAQTELPCSIENLLLLIGEVVVCMEEKSNASTERDGVAACYTQLGRTMIAVSVSAGVPAAIKAEEKAKQATAVEKVIKTSVNSTEDYLTEARKTERANRSASA
jgi:hypothetical protein